MFLTNNPFSDHGPSKQVLSEAFKYHIPEDIPANERTAFHGAAAAAAKAGKKNFNFGGKTHPVTMKKDLANKIVDQKESVESVNEAEYHPIKSFYHTDMAKAHASHAKRHKSEGDSGKHNDDNEDMHYRAIDIHKQAHAAHMRARDAAGMGDEKKYKKAAKDAHSLSQTAIGTTKDAGKFKTGTPKHKFPKLTLHTKLTKLTKSESTMTFREKLISVLEGDRKAHYKGATEPETMDDKLKGKGAKDMAKPAKDAISAKPTIDEPEIVKKDMAKMTANVKKSPMRKNDNAKGDSTIIAPGTPMKDPAKMQKEDFTQHPMNGKSMKDLLDAIQKVRG